MSTPPTPTQSLLHGAAIPVLGLGTWPMRGEQAATAVCTAVEAGYRLFDTAENYRNEEAVGQGLRESGIDRGEVFLTTKFNREWHGVDGVRRAYEASARRLGVDYLDLLMVHWPNPGQDRYVDAVRGLGRLLEDGSIRAVGVSNFKPRHLDRVIAETGLVPDVNQIQLSPYATREATRAYCAQRGIAVESWSPIGAADQSLRSDPVIERIAERHGKTATQTVLRWHVQSGLVTIPKSANPARMAENLAIFDFELSEAEMAEISGLDRGEGSLMDSDVFGH